MEDNSPFGEPEEDLPVGEISFEDPVLEESRMEEPKESEESGVLGTEEITPEEQGMTVQDFS
jgi:hypothetical protein